MYIRTRRLIVDLYRLTEKFPNNGRYGLTSQIRRAVVSVVTNIVEGSGKRTSRNYISYLNNAVGSIREVRVELEIAYDLGFISEEEMRKFVAECRSIDILLGRYILHVKEKGVM